MEDDLDALSKIPPFDKFQSTSSVWRTTPGVQPLATPPRYFNPRPPCGGRPLFTISFNLYLAFQSTSSVWRTTGTQIKAIKGFVDFNPRPPCGGRPAPRAGLTCGDDFNPRPPCGGRRVSGGKDSLYMLFQSTSSVWRTTVAVINEGRAAPNFNPRPPCGGRHDLRRWQFPGREISIHVLRVEDDQAKPAS